MRRRSTRVSPDHKVIGLQYGIMALLFLLFGFCWMLLMPEHPADSSGGDALAGGAQ